MQQIELIHPELGSLKKSVIKERLAKQLKVKEECVTIYGMKSKFGGGRSTGFALIYDNHDLLKKYDSKKELRKVSLIANSAFVRVLLDQFITNLLNSAIYFRLASSLRERLVARRARNSRPGPRRSRVPLRPRSPSARRRSEPLSSPAYGRKTVVGLPSVALFFD